MDFDSNGKFKGSGLIHFLNPNDAQKAINDYNEAEIDG